MAARLAILAFASAYSPVLRAIMLVALGSPQPPKLLVWYLVGGGGASGGRGYDARTIPRCDPAPGAASRVGAGACARSGRAT